MLQWVYCFFYILPPVFLMLNYSEFMSYMLWFPFSIELLIIPMCKCCPFIETEKTSVSISRYACYWIYFTNSMSPMVVEYSSFFHLKSHTLKHPQSYPSILRPNWENPLIIWESPLRLKRLILHQNLVWKSYSKLSSGESH